MKRSVGQPEMVERNKEIVDKKGRGWSYSKLADHYGISKARVIAIIQLYRNRGYVIPITGVAKSGRVGNVIA